MLPQAHDAVDYYRERWDAAGFDPASFGAVADLDAVPLSDDGIRGAVVFPAEEVDRHHHVLGSAGTTGERHFSMLGPEAADWLSALDARLKARYGMRPGDTLLRFPEPTVDPDRGWLSARLLPIRSVPRDASLAEQARRLEAVDPDCVLYFSHMLSALAAYVEQQDIDVSLTAAFTTGQILTPGMRDRIEDTFDCWVCDLYGTAEAGPIAYTCPETGRYHVQELFNAVQSREEAGGHRLITTQLRNRAGPVIRYPADDIVAGLRQGCDCGSDLLSFDRVLGRADRVHRLDGDLVYQADLLETVAPCTSLLAFAFAVDGDAVTLRYVPVDGVEEAGLDDVRDRLRALGFASVRFDRCDRIDRTPGGKLRTFER